MSSTSSSTSMPGVSSYRAAWDRYGEAWKDIDWPRRKLLLERCVAPNCLYSNPLIIGKGVDGLLDAIATFQAQVPGGSFLTSSFIQHHDKALAAWDLVDKDGKVISSGSNYLSFVDADHFGEICGFFALPPLGC